jgi:cytoskeletal protein CcmA (bactofilin family)
MWGSARKRKTTRIDTLIGQHTEVQGDVRFGGGLHVDGTIKGNVHARNDGKSMLSLSESGTIQGEVNVPYVVLNGVVIGDVHSSEHVELSSKARVTGNVYYSLIEMAVGAEVNGKLVHSPVPEDAAMDLGRADAFEIPE